ncbi:hypothetical protein Poli38472_009751 [Pythium oligandrum]|uniref:Uncharacterized protein n=1 Tax=Pythium oligandrum TaxID=41045 RepID=A0A8K1CGU9_PYTOL|nr:hypothetical protein Poli38472_009751 [Pythium oligandrum]|eukprot:TMW62258.1 hypothetical protein Poli38472_009751 [Pythium oligandrum]
MVNIRALCLLAVALAPSVFVSSTVRVKVTICHGDVPIVKENKTVDALPHWVGPVIGEPIDDACYRKTLATKTCPLGFESDGIASCWAQCPLEYPVECGMECLPQNEDCTEAILKKVTAAATVALNAATLGVFGGLAKASKAATQGFKCGQQLLSVVQNVNGFIDDLKASSVDSTTDEILFALTKSTFVTTDLPVAVAACLGRPVPTSAAKADDIAKIVTTVTETVLEAKSQGKELLEPANFVQFVADVGLGAADVNSEEVSKIKDTVTKGLACGQPVASVVNRVVSMVQEVKTNDSSITVEALRLSVMGSDLVLQDLPDVVNGCFNKSVPDAFKKRDEVLKGAHVILDGVIEASSNEEDKPLSTADYALKIGNMGLDAIALFDPTGLADLASEFLQPICGPTIFIGDVDDGPADQALGLHTIEKAFVNSTGEWKKQGDGNVVITFTSVDDEDVEVIIKSGGDDYDKVEVESGEIVEWSTPLSDLQGKTLYLDRWRPGFLGIPGTGGGSLLLWVPNTASGGLNLSVLINPTSFSDDSSDE